MTKTQIDYRRLAVTVWCLAVGGVIGYCIMGLILQLNAVN